MPMGLVQRCAFALPCATVLLLLASRAEAAPCTNLPSPTIGLGGSAAPDRERGRQLGAVLLAEIRPQPALQVHALCTVREQALRQALALHPGFFTG